MRETPPSRYPPGFESWDWDRRINHLTVIHSREGLIRLALNLAWYDTSREVDSKTRLRKAELAAIVLALDPNRESPAHSNRWD